MKSWISKVVIALAAVAGLPAAVLGVLAVQGKLESPETEAFRHVPVLGALLPPAAEEEETEPGSLTGRPTPAPARSVDGAWREKVDLRDPDALVAELKARSRLYDRKIDELERERRKLERLRAELDDRQQILDRLQDMIVQEKGEIQAREKALVDRGRIISEKDARTLKDTARAIAEMDTTAAAEALGDIDELRAASILRVMDPSAAGAIFSDMKDTEKRKRLLELYTSTHVETSAGGK